MTAKQPDKQPVLPPPVILARILDEVRALRQSIVGLAKEVADLKEAQSRLRDELRARPTTSQLL